MLIMTSLNLIYVADVAAAAAAANCDGVSDDVNDGVNNDSVCERM